MIKLIDFIQKNSKVYIIVGLLLILNIIGFSMFSLHEYKLYSNTGKALKQATDKLKNAKKDLKSVSDTYKTVQSVKKRLLSFKTKDLKKGSFFEKEMTKLLFNALKNNNINFQSLSYGEKEILKGNIKKRPIHIPIKATYTNFRKLLTDLEALPFPAMIDKVAISSANSGEISATIDIITYYRR
jgi:Tfp pilus assembly protein PilO